MWNVSPQQLPRPGAICTCLFCLCKLSQIAAAGFWRCPELLQSLQRIKDDGLCPRPGLSCIFLHCCFCTEAARRKKLYPGSGCLCPAQQHLNTGGPAPVPTSALPGWDTCGGGWQCQPALLTSGQNVTVSNSRELWCLSSQMLQEKIRPLACPWFYLEADRWENLQHRSSLEQF